MQEHQLWGIPLSAACLVSILSGRSLHSISLNQQVQRGDCCPNAGSGTQRKDDTMVSSLQRRLNESQASGDSSRGSESAMVPWDSPAGLGTQGQSEHDSLGTEKSAPGPGSVQSDMTDEGSASRSGGRPAAGWKGRMSSMLLRGPLNSPKSETIKALKVSTCNLGFWVLISVFLRCLWFASVPNEGRM